jgi:hypothetical protein
MLEGGWKGRRETEKDEDAKEHEEELLCRAHAPTVYEKRL